MKKLMIKNIGNKNFFSKKSRAIAAMSTLSVSVTLGAGISQIILSQSKYVYDGRTFNTYKELLNYVKNNSSIKNIENNSSWSITSNGVTKNYTDPETLRKDLYNNYITSTTSLVGSKSKGVFGAQLKNNSFVTSAYKGFGGVTYENEDDAYKSYFDTKSAFYFNGTYFENRSDLKQYLLSDYFPTYKSSNSSNTIILKSPSGIESSPINLSSTSAFSNIDSFIKNNANSSLVYTNKKTNKTLNINSSNVESNANSVSLSDLDYIHAQSNQGESRYIIDNDTADGGNIIGPYFYNGVLDVGAFNNRSMWKKVNNVKDQVYTQSKIDISIGSFFSSIINDDPALNIAQAENTESDPLLFRTLLSTPDGKSYDQWFLNELQDISPKLKNAVVEANNTMMKGKKYNTFYKMTVLYNFLLSRIVSWGLGQNVLNLIIDYFTNVANFIQEAIEFVTLYNPDLLMSKDGKTKFNVKDFFQIGNPEYDYNTSSQYFLTQLKDNYPKLIAVINTYVSALNNITMVGGLIPFDAIDNSSLITTGIFKNQSEYESITDKLKAIYDVFSSLNTTDMMTLFVKNSGRDDIKALSNLTGDNLLNAFTKLKTNFGDISLETMLSGIGSKNTKYYQLASSILKTEIRVYLSTGSITKGGYLWQLYSTNSNNDKLGSFINFVIKNTDLASNSLYRIYLAFTIDKRVANNQFLNTTSTKTWTNFAHALSQLVLFSLGSIYSTSLTISKLFNHSTTGSSLDLIPSASSSPMLDLFNDSVSIQSLSSSRQASTFSRSSDSSSNSTNSSTSNKKYALLTKKAASTGKLIQARSNTKTDLFTLDVTKSSGIPNKTIVLAGLPELLVTAASKEIAYSNENGIVKFVDIRKNNSQSFKAFLKETTYTQVIGSKNNGNVIGVMYPSDDAMCVNAQNFNLVEDLYNRFCKAISKTNTSTNNWPNNTQFVSSKENQKFNVITRSNNNIVADNNGNNSSVNNNVGSNVNINNPMNPGQNNNPIREDPWEFIRLDQIDDGRDSGYFSENGSIVSGSDIGIPGWNRGNRRVSGSFEELASVYSETESFSSSSTSLGNQLNRKSWWSGSLTTFNKIKEVITSIANFALSAFAVAFTALELFFFMYNLFSETTIQDFYVYTTTDGTQFIWDGGRTVSKFLGLSVNQTVGINDMLLLNPVQITLPLVEEFYYFNGVKYYDNTEELKRNQLIYMLNGGKVMNNNFSSYYSFDVNFSGNNGKTIDDLVANVITSLGLVKKSDGSFDFTKINKNSSYISSTSSTLFGVTSTSPSDNFVSISTLISQIIRPTIYVRIPDLDSNNIATGTISSDGSKFPGNYWDGSKIITNDSRAKYLVDNSANELIDESLSFTQTNNFKERDIEKALKVSKEALYTKFKGRFGLSSKKVWKDDINKNDIFDNLTEVKSETLYFAKINGTSKTFNSLENATSYILNKLNFKKTSNYNQLYTYKGKTYYSESELMKYVLSNCEIK